jgi:hypothetical protein
MSSTSKCASFVLGLRHAHTESAVSSAAMRWLRRADLGIEKIAYRTTQNLYSVHRVPKVTDAAISRPVACHRKLIRVPSVHRC